MASNKVNINVPLPSFELQLDGEWSKVDNLPEELIKAISEGYEKGVTEISKDIVKIVKRAISTGLPPQGSGVSWAPLSPTTIKSHGAHNIYNLTGFYERSIGVNVYKNRVLIGIPLNLKTTGGLTLNQLAILLEHGSTNTGGGGIPKRPLWAPSLESYGGNKKIKKVLISRIKSSIKKRTGINPKDVGVLW